MVYIRLFIHNISHSLHYMMRTACRICNIISYTRGDVYIQQRIKRNMHITYALIRISIYKPAPHASRAILYCLVCIYLFSLRILYYMYINILQYSKSAGKEQIDIVDSCCISALSAAGFQIAINAFYSECCCILYTAAMYIWIQNIYRLKFQRCLPHINSHVNAT